MDILICEDDLVQLQNLQKIVQNYLQTNLKTARLVASCSKSQQLVQIIQRRQYQLGAVFLLDIDLQEQQLNGLEIAKLIRQHDSQSTIIFITAHAELAYLPYQYKIEALDYVVKAAGEHFTAQIQANLQAAAQKNKLQLQMNSQAKINYLHFKIGAKQIVVNEADFYYAETSINKHRLIIYTTTEQLEVYGTLNELLHQSSLLMRCHNSYLVNYQQIQTINFNTHEIILNNNYKCYFSRRYATKLKSLNI